MSDTDLAKEYISSFKNGVGKNCVVLTPDELGQPWLYHISTNPKIKKFIPQLTQRSAPKEDRSVPRISTAPTLLGCILGYQQDQSDWYAARSNKSWRDGWYIYGFENEVCIKPKTDILYDVDKSDECWLVPYKNDKWEYPAKVIGKYFYRTVIETQLNNGGNKIVEVFLEVSKGSEVRFDEKTVFTEGFWHFKFSRWVNKWKNGEVTDLRKIDAGEWSKTKGLSADLLSLVDYPSTKW